MLEQYDLRKGTPSNRFLEIQSFLEEAVKIVPVESVILAIGYAPEFISEDCTKLFVDSNPSFSPSVPVLEGLKRALFRMQTGLDASWYDVISTHCNRCLEQQIPPGHAHFDVIPVKVPSGNMPPGFPLGLPPGFPHRFPMCSGVRLNLKNITNVMYPNDPIPHYNVQVEAHFFYDDQISRKAYSAFFAGVISKMKKKLPIIGETQPYGVSIDHVYPAVSSARRRPTHTKLLSPLDVLIHAREKIATFIEDKLEEDALQSSSFQNEEMLTLVKEVRERSLRICAQLLGSFMEQRIRIPLLKDQKNTAELLSSKSSPVAIGCWALYSSSIGQLKSMLSHQEGHPIVVEITDYISGLFFSDEEKKEKKKSSRKNARYNGKLQFILLCSRVVTCSSEYVSYSLESQIAKRFQFARKISLSVLVQEWDIHFKGDALSLVQKAFRPLIGRWLKWALLIYDLRESLAKYTCVGVTGLVNSGKS